jgi:hypothetical protein
MQPLFRLMRLVHPKATVMFSMTVRLTVVILTSNKTRYRLETLLANYREENVRVNYLLVHSDRWELSPSERRLGESIPLACEDTWNGLVCKEIGVYKYFLAQRKLGNWLYRAIDDTFLNVSNLLTLISLLEQVYDSSKHIVFRGGPNREFHSMGMVWLGGGCGWLMSRPMVAAHFMKGFTFEDSRVSANQSGQWPHDCTQDDCLTTRIVGRIFGSMGPWADDQMTDDLEYIQYDQDGKPTFSHCHSHLTVTLRKASEIVSAHCGWDVRYFTCSHICGLPENIYTYRTNRRGLAFCSGGNGTVVMTPKDILEDLRKKAVFLTLEDLAVPKRPMPMTIGYN